MLLKNCVLMIIIIHITEGVVIILFCSQNNCSHHKYCNNNKNLVIKIKNEKMEIVILNISNKLRNVVFTIYNNNVQLRKCYVNIFKN